MFYETSQNRPWRGTYPSVCVAWELCSHWNRQWNYHRQRSWDCALVPLPHLRPWPQKEPAPNLVLPGPPAPGQRRSKPTSDREQNLKRTGGCPITFGIHAIPTELVSKKKEASPSVARSRRKGFSAVTPIPFMSTVHYASNRPVGDDICRECCCRHDCHLQIATM